jgi:hypothetical protein
MREVPKILFYLLCGTMVMTAALGAQEAGATLPARRTAAQTVQAPPPRRGQPHHFWERTNLGLFAGVGAVRVLDFTSTQHFRAQGVHEVLLSDDIADNKTLLAGIEVAGVAASIGVVYLLHRTGHHRLERWVSIVHIGVGAGSSAWNYTRDGPLHPGPLP